MNSPRVDAIEQRLRATFAPLQLTIRDDSQQHAGHRDPRDGGHFSVYVVSAAFAGQTLIKRHRAVHDCLADLMPNEIHALSIKAQTPEELQQSH